MKKKPVCIYVDNSNIYIGGQFVAKKRNEDNLHLRIDFENFLHLVSGGGKKFNELVWAGSGPPELESIFKSIENKGADIHMIPRNIGGENECVDQDIQLAMYRHHRKYRKNPGVMVLCTGDGKGFHEEKGFLFDLKGFVEDGWKLHLYCWNATCHKKLKQFAKTHGFFVPLEKHYRNITFIKDGRPARPVRL